MLKFVVIHFNIVSLQYQIKTKEIMKISELPQDVKAKALQYQKIASERWYKKTDDLKNAFNWDDTKEGLYYWKEWHSRDVESPSLLEQLTELRKQYPNDFDFGREVAKLIQL